ncbi:MAG TPA: branched-chain amino acid ABC transporter permease [Dehalococcoidia bacterium]|nr:branched-chain amino acid ABC transporter permease [Dehalococcoidia bacterium]
MLVSALNIVINGLLLGGLYALVAMGLNLQYGVARVLNIAHGEFIMLGAFITWAMYTKFGINPLLSIVIVGPIVFIIGFIIQRTLFTSLRTSAPSQPAFEGSSMLASFGLLFIIQNVALIIWGGDMRAYSYYNFGINLGGAVFAANRLIALIFAVVIGIAFYIFLVRTRIGKAIRAAAEDPTTAGIMGVNINLVLALCFGLGAVMAGLAGVFLSMCFPIYPVMGLEYLIITLIVVVLGGLGSIPGSFIGGFILGLIGSAVSSWQPSLALAAYYFIFMLLLIIRPKGILGK